MGPNVCEGTLKRKRVTKYLKIDEAHMLWFSQHWAGKGNVVDAMLVEK